MHPEPPLVQLPALVGRQAESWLALIEIAPRLGTAWALVGGQMVLLHVVERQSLEGRPTADVDVVMDVRADSSSLAHMHRVLSQAGFSQDQPSPDGVAHRYRRSGATIDVLAPDHMGTRAKLNLGVGRTIEAPGSSQALVRSSHVRVELVNGASAVVRRPTLIGALLGKTAAVFEIVSQPPAERAKHLGDADTLARLIGPTDRQSAFLKSKERAALQRLLQERDLSALAAASLHLLVEHR